MTDPHATAGGAAPAGPVSMLTCAECGKKNKIRPSERGAPHCGACGKPLPWLVNATDATFGYEARSSVAILVDLWAPWCGPCRQITPVIEELADENAGSAKVLKVNIDDNPQTAQQLNVMSIPTLIVFKAGAEAARFVGVQPKARLQEALDAAKG